ncbi:hypothetical protein SNEBB_000727 [Seison nebaliae]|nr:hypothetical protein SNEBB_000727 [Seison nebaliae]
MKVCRSKGMMLLENIENLPKNFSTIFLGLTKIRFQYIKSVVRISTLCYHHQRKNKKYYLTIYHNGQIDIDYRSREDYKRGYACESLKVSNKFVRKKLNAYRSFVLDEMVMVDHKSPSLQNCAVQCMTYRSSICYDYNGSVLEKIARNVGTTVLNQYHYMRDDICGLN